MRDVGLSIGCSSVIGAVFAFLIAPSIQRRFAGTNATSFKPALVIILLGAAIGALMGFDSARRKRW